MTFRKLHCVPPSVFITSSV